MKLVIFGAQGYALGTYDAITTIYPEKQVECFLVSSLQGNAPTLAEKTVVELGDFANGMSNGEKSETLIYIATPENIQDEVASILENYGFTNLVRVDSAKWTELMEMYFAKSGDYKTISSLGNGGKLPEVTVYMAKFYKDKELRNDYSIPDFVHPIQVGAANTDIRISDLCDDIGDNISHKNPNYSELTGLYWIWKNALCVGEDTDNRYYGLCQYRRMFELSDEDLRMLTGNDVDVVLPYPLPYEPNIHAHHERYIKDVDWKALNQALRELQPEYADAFEDILNQRYLFNYNVILAKKKVLRDYCAWLFPILERTEELSVPKGADRADRYIGYMGETLETLYFMCNSNNLNIVHTNCRMLV